jgi:hypothetical protein
MFSLKFTVIQIRINSTGNFRSCPRSDVATGSLVRVGGENVGAYAINKGTYTYGTNYDETYVSKDLTIGKRAITITADVQSKVYAVIQILD